MAFDDVSDDRYPQSHPLLVAPRTDLQNATAVSS
jgi:hypothetical protein